MPQGVYVRGDYPKTKKALKEAALTAPESISLEAVSFFGNDYEGDALNMPEFQTVYVVGPDPHHNRKWYAQVTRQGTSILVR